MHRGGAEIDHPLDSCLCRGGNQGGGGGFDDSRITDHGMDDGVAAGQRSRKGFGLTGVRQFPIEFEPAQPGQGVHTPDDWNHLAEPGQVEHFHNAAADKPVGSDDRHSLWKTHGCLGRPAVRRSTPARSSRFNQGIGIVVLAE